MAKLINVARTLAPLLGKTIHSQQPVGGRSHPSTATTPIHRRRFLCFSVSTSSVAAAALLRYKAAWPNSVDSKAVYPVDRNVAMYRRSGWALGSNVTITVLHPDAKQADRGLIAAFTELETIEQLMSIYRADSQLSQLNQDGRLTDPHPYLLQVLRTAEMISRRSGGAFDVTVQPLWQLNRRSMESGRTATDAEIARARRHVDWRQVKTLANRVDLRGEDTNVTLNGIAQGFAADRVRAVLANHGISAALVDTGELASMGRKQTGRAWRVGIQHPRQPDAFLRLVHLAGRCLATSGDYATPFTVDRREHHLFDPRTGLSPQELCSASVVAPTAMLADAMSTAIFVLGVDRGMRLVRNTRGADALMVTKQGRVVVTDGFPLAEHVAMDDGALST